MDESRRGPQPWADLLRALFGDLQRPGVEQVAQALARVLGLGQTLLWPTVLANPAGQTLRGNLDSLRERLAELEPEEVAAVAPEIGVPIAERLAYVADPGLADLYLNLLVKAASHATSYLAHPGFVPIIASLSPDEAVLLPFLQKEMPFLEARLSSRVAGSWRTLNPILTNLEDEADLLFPENIVAYLSNLEGLGLISIRPDLYIASADGRYRELEAGYRPIFENLQHNPRTDQITFEKGKILPTPFAKLFIQACLE
jgi:hypothetical protein